MVYHGTGGGSQAGLADQQSPPRCSRRCDPGKSGAALGWACDPHFIVFDESRSRSDGSVCSALARGCANPRNHRSRDGVPPSQGTVHLSSRMYAACELSSRMYATCGRENSDARYTA
jgi:hypothetical protein